MVTTRRLDQLSLALGFARRGLRGGLAWGAQQLLGGVCDMQQLHQPVPIVCAQGIAFEPLQQPRAFFWAEQVLFMLECPPQGDEVLGRTMGQIRQGPGFDLAVFPVGLPQEDAAMGDLAPRRLGEDFSDIHDYDSRRFLSSLQGIFVKNT